MAVAALEGQVAEGETLFFVQLCFAVYAAQLACSLAFFESGAVFSVALGGGVTLLNLRFLSAFLKAILSGGVSEGYARMAAVISFYIRFTAFGASLYFLAEKGMVNFPALAVGLSVVPLAVLAFAVVQSMKAMKGDYGRAY
jgi:hypothetical protein